MTTKFTHAFTPDGSVGNWRHLKRELQDKSSDTCRHIRDRGMVDLAMNDSEWTKEANGDPRPEIVRPIKYAANAKKSEKDEYNRELADYAELIKSETLLKSLLLDAIGEVNRKLLEEKDTGMRLVTCKKIIDKMDLVHGTATKVSIQNLMAKTEAPINNTETPALYIANMRNAFTELAEIGSATTVHDYFQYSKLESGLKPRFETKEAIKAFKILNPNVASHTFEALATHIILYADNIDKDASEYTTNFAGASSASPSESQEQILIRLLGQVLPSIIQAQLKGGQDHTARGRPTRANVPTLTGPKVKGYCYCHGYTFHDGGGVGDRVCTTMKSNPKYTDAMRAAKGPTDVAGGSTRNMWK